MTTGYHEVKKKPLICLMKDIFNDFAQLLYLHTELFKSEVKEDAKTSAKVTLLAIVSIISIQTGFLFLGLFLIFALSTFLAPWLAALIVTLLYFFSTILFVLTIRKSIKAMKTDDELVKKEFFKTMEVMFKWLQLLKLKKK